jgi:DNA-binding SARP family transcriptional activator
LITLGGLALTRDGAPYSGAAAQRRRLALLSVLAASGAAGVSRDKQLAYFWPDSGEDQARHALNQALHQIRQALGAESITSTSTSLALNPAVVSSDVADFDQASADRALERAATLYQGPFLDGFFLSDAPDFERWVTTTRSRLARTWASLVDSLATAAAGRRDRAAVVRWRQQLANADPLNANSIIALVEAHVAAGDRAAALRAVTAHDSLVRTELDSEPDEEIQQWMARLKSAPRTSSTAHVSEPMREPVTGEARIRSRIERAAEGRYVFDRVLSKGAVLTTIAATDMRDHTPVALHIVSTQAMAHADPERFVRTLLRVGAAGDPRIVPVLDASATDELTYFVTPPTSGPTLRERLARDGELAIADAVRLARDLAATLAVAHANNVTHGDLRPKHIGLLTDGVIVGGWSLVDALAPAGELGGSSSALETSVTIVAPAYASPEQLEGGRLPDARSDVYSLGCVLFEALAGMPPFAPTGGHAILVRKLTEPAPSVRDARASVPEELDAVLRTCLARSPADRYPSGGALADALAVVS